MIQRQLEPVKVSTPNSGWGVFDLANGGFNLTHLMKMVMDCDQQPSGWRDRADLAAAYVDGKQLTAEQLQALNLEHMPDVRATNLVGRVVRSVCGQEAKARTDIKVDADDDDTSDLIDFFGAKVKEAQRECYADMAVSQAYFGQVGPGIGWVEVAKNSDPRLYNYRVQEVHRSEMWWDWAGAKRDVLLQGARWMVRKRWEDLDELEARMPQHAALLQRMANGWDSLAFDDTADGAVLADRWQEDRVWCSVRRRSEWYDRGRGRVKMYEVWYKIPAWGVFLHLSPTRRLLYNPQNQAHVQAVASQQVRVTKELTHQIRMSLFAGPHRLQDLGTKRRNFPYVPFIAYRDDEDFSPYGLVEGMIGPQDEYNARRLRINWLLRARQILVDNDALDTKVNSLKEVAEAIMRPDMTVVLNSMRKNANGFQVMNNLQLQREQVDVMQDAKQLIQDVPGVYGSQLGQPAAGVTSGIANSLLIEQGAVSMGDLNDNYRHSRRLVFENLLDLIVEDHENGQIPVKVGTGSNRRVVVLNQWDPENLTIVNNVADAPLRVGLGEVPNTPAYRMQQQQQIATIINALANNPQAVAVLTPVFVESTDIQNRQEIADDIRRLSGQPTAGDKQRAQQMEEAGRAQAEKQQQLAEAAAQLDMQERAAKVEKTKSETELNNAKSVQIGHEMGMAEVQQDQAQGEVEQPGAQDPDRAIDDSIQEALTV